MKRKIFLPIWFVVQTKLIEKTKINILLLLLILLLPLHNLFSQVNISGYVKEKNGTPVSYASISIKGTVFGISTDSLGKYSLQVKEKGEYFIVASATGYETLEKDIRIDSNSIIVNITLQPAGAVLGQVVVAAGSFEASDKKKGAVMSPIDVVTTAGNNGDIANASRTLPGAQQIGESEGLFVRGGTGEETKQFVDGTLMKSTNFSSVPGILQPARVSPFLFDGIVFSSGGYSVLYGQALSGALILESVDMPEQSSAVIGLSPLVAVAGFQSLAKDNRSSYGINARYFNTRLYNKIIKQTPDYFHGPEYFTGDANFRMRTGKNGMLKFYTNVGYSHIGVRTPDPDSAVLKSSFEVEGINVYNNVSYQQQLSGHWKIAVGLTYNYSHDNIYNQLLDAANEIVQIPDTPFNAKNRVIHNSGDFINSKIVLTHFINRNHTVRFGTEYFYSKDKYRFTTSRTSLTDHLIAVFAEDDWRIATDIAARIGLRYERSTLTGKSAIAPRISMAWKTGKNSQLNFAYGIFCQKADNRYLLLDNELDFTNAIHYIINYTHKADNRFFRIESYYKTYHDLVKTKPSVSTNGEGYAKGIELFYRDKKSIRGFDYWFTYTFLDTRRNWLDYPGSLHPSFSTPHTMSVVAKRFFSDINLSANAAYTFATGRPYYNFQPGSGDAMLVHDRGTTKPYHGLNLSFSYLTSFFKKAKNKDFTVVAFGLNNVIGNKQVFGYNYSFNGNNKSAITLTAPRSFFFGIFMSFGINRTEDFKNENL